MGSSRIKIVLPQELVQELNEVDGFDIQKSEEVLNHVQDYKMNLGDVFNPDTLQTTASTSIAIIAFLSNINGAVTLLEKIRAFFTRNPKGGNKIQIITPTKQITINEGSAPEVYEELKNLLEKMASK